MKTVFYIFLFFSFLIIVPYGFAQNQELRLEFDNYFGSNIEIVSKNTSSELGKLIPYDLGESIYFSLLNMTVWMPNQFGVQFGMSTNWFTSNQVPNYQIEEYIETNYEENYFGKNYPPVTFNSARFNKTTRQYQIGITKAYQFGMWFLQPSVLIGFSEVHNRNTMEVLLKKRGAHDLNTISFTSTKEKFYNLQYGGRFKLGVRTPSNLNFFLFGMVNLMQLHVTHLIVDRNHLTEEIKHTKVKESDFVSHLTYGLGFTIPVTIQFSKKKNDN